MTIITDRKILQARIASIAKVSGKLREAIQAVIPGAIFHAYTHGDVSLGSRIIEATKGVERQAIVVYLETYGPFRWDKANGAFKLNKARAKHEEFDAEFFESAECPKWWEFTKDTKSLESSFDLEVRVLSLIKSMGNAKDKGKEVKNEDLSEYLQAAVAKWHSDAALKAAREAGDQVMRTDTALTPEQKAELQAEA